MRFLGRGMVVVVAHGKRWEVAAGGAGVPVAWVAVVVVRCRGHGVVRSIAGEEASEVVVDVMGSRWVVLRMEVVDRRLAWPWCLCFVIPGQSSC